MKIVTISLILVILAVNATAKPTFDVIADIVHELVNDPNLSPHQSQPQYAYSGVYPQNTYDIPGYSKHGGYGYNQRPLQPGSASFYSHNAPNGYYPSNPYNEHYPAIHEENGYPYAVYENQGYYKGSQYPANRLNGYHYNNGQYKLRGY